MPHITLPPCLHDLETLARGPGLVLARCGYRPDAFAGDAFAHAGIPLPAGLEKAVAKRRTEYLAGRVCARAALGQATGLEAVPAIGDDRAPCWPDGAVGAITHSHGQAAALVGRHADWQGLGLDAEHWLAPDRARRLAGQLLTPAEREALGTLDDTAFARRLTRVFSIKESLFKALYPITGVRFYFQDAEMVAEDHIALRRDLSDQWRRGATVEALWRDEDQGVLSWIAVPRGRKSLGGRD
ncbi:4'-phosphopantetheinyl transferase family protein [Alloalcanivorax gelatiniphagus]|uniref:Enterobactin synthase component D n=2 Tax=Alloalcanivorax gelatiniphagus TaxID=1194167 RepID=A0ABY2XKK8_9GAMM|nr:4'-phosphopantetheinyl transferase superfamily protein [Alloalcanivorax gelatiniphagus]TMW12581.1 4'-phosphopantetheinyl transferase superfamily protein [Alloalcanivorax gelatiniphagus]